MSVEPTSTIERLWPLFGLRVRSAGIELRYPTDRDLVALAELAKEPIHAPDVMPFETPWSANPPAERARGVLQWHWKARGEWAEERWRLELVAVREGQVVGTQGCHGDHFAVTREVASGSWVGGAFQGQGIGTAMRRAMLHLAFAGLGATQARSAAFTDNTASRRVSEKLGYAEDGTETFDRGGEQATMVRYVLTRAVWERLSFGWPPVEVDGVEACRPLFGLSETPP